MKKILDKYKFILVLLVLVIIFFSSSLVLTFDSTHYLTYVNILEGNAPFSSWDIVRGPVFPIILYINNLIFGRSGIGMLLGMFIFYLVYCFVVYKMSEELFKNSKHKSILTFLICAFSFINPIILGYYHTMLTEYVAITLTMCSLYLAWKWPNIKTTKEKILYSLYFICGTVISYHLKQPYLCVVFIPMIISVIYTFINKTKKLYYIATVITSIIVLFSSILIWNKFLEYKGVDLKTGRDAGGMLSSQLLNAIEGYKIEEISSYENVKNDKYLTKEEKKIVKKEVKIGNKVYIVDIYDNKKLLEKDVLKLSTGDKPSGKDTVLEITNTFFKYPNIVVTSYAKNYCGLSSVCLITSDDGVMYSVTNKLDLVKMFENEVIPFKSFRMEEKNFYYPEERHEFVKGYLSPINQGFISKLITYTFKPTSIIFKFVTFLLFLFNIILIVFRIIRRKKLKNKELYLFSLLFLSSAFLTMVANALVGAMIDRYTVVCFIPATIGMISSIIFITNNINLKRSTKHVK